MFFDKELGVIRGPFLSTFMSPLFILVSIFNDSLLLSVIFIPAPNDSPKSILRYIEYDPIFSFLKLFLEDDCFND